MGQMRILGAFPPRVRLLALGLGLVQLGLIAAHLLAYDAASSALDPKVQRKLLDFNQEGSVQTFWSAAVMAAAGLTVLWTASRRRSRSAQLTAAWLIVGAGFVWIAAEELIHVHEDVQVATGIDWPLIYVPALVAGGWAIMTVARDLPAAALRLMVVALGCLVAAVSAELLSSPQIAIEFNLRNLFEENLELAGASLVLLASVAVLEPGVTDPEPLVADPTDPSVIFGSQPAKP